MSRSQLLRLRHQRRQARSTQHQQSHQNQRRLLWATITSTALAAIVTVFATGFATAIGDAVTGMFSDSPVPQVKSTDVRYLRPFGTEGKPSPGFSIHRQYDGGRCVAGMQSTDKGTYRCFTGHYVFDPCWRVDDDYFDSKPDVGCLGDPWSRELTMIHLAREIGDGSGRPTTAPPWALEVQHPGNPGVFMHCTREGGTANWINALPFIYRCTDSSGRYIGWAGADVKKREDRPWSVLFAEKGSDEIVRALIRTVWM
jgi:hypothetical protein